MNATSTAVDSAEAPPSIEASVETLYATGHWLFSQDRFADAAAVFRVMLHAAPTDERPWLALGECHERIEQLHLALELYGTGMIAAAPAPRCATARARVLRRLERDDEADAAFDVALALAEEHEDDALLAVLRREGARR